MNALLPLIFHTVPWLTQSWSTAHLTHRPTLSRDRKCAIRTAALPPLNSHSNNPVIGSNGSVLSWPNISPCRRTPPANSSSRPAHANSSPSSSAASASPSPTINFPNSPGATDPPRPRLRRPKGKLTHTGRTKSLRGFLQADFRVVCPVRKTGRFPADARQNADTPARYSNGRRPCQPEHRCTQSRTRMRSNGTGRY